MEQKLENIEVLVASLIQFIGALRKEQSILEEQYSNLHSLYQCLLNELNPSNTQQLPQTLPQTTSSTLK